MPAGIARPTVRVVIGSAIRRPVAGRHTQARRNAHQASVTAAVTFVLAATLVASLVPKVQAWRSDQHRTAGRSIAEVYRTAVKSVVLVEVTPSTTSAVSRAPSRGDLEPSGSGFAYGESTIVTSAHVVGDASSIAVRLSDGRTLPARLRASDRASDIAVLQVDAPAGVLQPLRLADSSQVEVGDTVLAIGSPFGLQGSVTSGIVSGVGRTISSPESSPIDGVIQTDAAINHGNSGGPLLDMYGNVVGIVAQFLSASGGSNGVGLVVPSSVVARVADSLLDRAGR